MIDTDLQFRHATIAELTYNFNVLHTFMKL